MVLLKSGAAGSSAIASISDRFSAIAAAKAGISLIHVSTELRVAWREGLDKVMKEKPDEIAPYKLLGDVVKDVAKVVERRIKLFSGMV